MSVPYQKPNVKKIVNRLILFIGIGIICHVVFVLSTTEKHLLQYLLKLSVIDVFTIVLLMLYPWFSYAARVFMWSGFLKEKITYAECIRVVITADLTSALSPTSVGGAPVKAALLLQKGYAPGSVGFMLTYGVIEDIIFYTSGILLAVYFSYELVANMGFAIVDFLQHHFLQVTVYISIIIIYIYLLYKNLIPQRLRLMHYLPIRVKDKIRSIKSTFMQSFRDMRVHFKMAIKHGKLRVLTSITLLFIQWMSKFTVLYVLLSAFNIEFDAIQIYIRQWVVYVMMLLIPTPGASGGAEASFLLIFGKSIPSEIANLTVSLWRLFTYYFLLFSAVIFYNLITLFTYKSSSDNAAPII